MKTKWAIEPYDPKAYLTAYNFDPVIKESLNCLNELHKTKPYVIMNKKFLLLILLILKQVLIKLWIFKFGLMNLNQNRSIVK